MLTKKESIWLGIRIIGLTWLFQLLYQLFELIWFSVYGLWLAIKGTGLGGLAESWLTRLSTLPYPLIFTVYFLLFGRFVYKLINRCSRSRPQNPALPAGYDPCDIIVRFCGVWVFFMMFNRIYFSFLTSLQSVIRYCFLQPERVPLTVALASFFRHFNLWVIVSLGLYLALAILFAGYFLKKGEFFINLLHRLWMGKIAA